MRRAGLIAAGGAAGAVVRYLATTAGNALVVTLLVNLAGAFALGVLVAHLAARPEREGLLRPLLGVGFLGAFTTFSTFAALVVQLDPMQAAAYAAATVVLGVGAAGAGLARGHRR